MTTDAERMTKVEEVARAIEPIAWAMLGMCDTKAAAKLRKTSMLRARAAIEAMRVPSAPMAWAIHDMTGCGMFKASDAWQEAITAALGETDE